MTLLFDHWMRVHGLLGWTRFGPRYTLEADGRLTSAGRLDRIDWRFESPAQLRRNIVGVLRASNLFEKLYGYPEREDEEETAYGRALLVAIVARINEIVRQRYGAPFTVIGWDDAAGSLGPTLAALRARGVDAVDKSELLAGPWSPDYLIAGDGHPSAKANREIASALAARHTGCR